MPLAHACASCGRDLSRIPAPLDSHYRWPIVVCPTCSAAVVRRSDGHRVLSRRAARIARALRRLLMSGALLTAVGTALAASTAVLRGSLSDSGHALGRALLMFARLTEPTPAHEAWTLELGPAALVAWMVGWTVTGAYLALALHHAPRWKVALLFAAAVALLTATPGLARFYLQPDWAHGPPELSFYLASAGSNLRFMLFGAPLALIGLPLGRRLDRHRARVELARWRRLRRRIRRHRRLA